LKEDKMKTKIGVAVLLGLVAMCGIATSATEPPCLSPILIKFDNDTFAYETAYTNATYTSAPASVLKVIGKIVCLGLPLAYTTGNEYTVVMTGLVSAGTVHTTPFGSDQYNTDYSGGSFTIYEDTTPDVPTAATLGTYGLPPGADALYTDGTAILSGTIDYFHTLISRASTTGKWSGSFNALYTSTGGSLFGLIGGAQSNLNGLWCSLGAGSGQCSLPAGYSAHPSGKFDVPASTAASSSTWGKLKLLYR
jgi:hypothetical protein